MDILIAKLSAIGDVLHTLPALNAVRRHYPGARITWLIEKAAADLITEHPAVDRVIIAPQKQWLKDLKTQRRGRIPREIHRFICNLRDTRYDWVLDFQALLKSGLWILLARADQKIGFGPGMDHMEYSYFVLNRRLPAVSMEIHALKRNLMMVAALGVPTDRVEYRLPILPSHEQSVEKHLSSAGFCLGQPLAAINPAAKWPTKLWLEKRFAELGDALQRVYGLQVVFTGSIEDRPAIQRIRSVMTRPGIDLSGLTSLRELAAVYRKASVVISTDTGPMHLAAAVRAPLAALFGPTAPWRTGPYGNGKIRVVRTGISCSPCFKRHCAKPGCMSGISVKQVLAAVEKLL